MKTEEKSVNNKKLIPFWVIERALEGDIQAINKILNQYGRKMMVIHGMMVRLVSILFLPGDRIKTFHS